MLALIQVLSLNNFLVGITKVSLAKVGNTSPDRFLTLAVSSLGEGKDLILKKLSADDPFVSHQASSVQLYVALSISVLYFRCNYLSKALIL